MIQNVFIIFIPLDKFGNDDVTKKRVIFDSGYVHSIEVVKLKPYRFVYRVYRDNGMVTYFSCKSYRFSLGVNKY